MVTVSYPGVYVQEVPSGVHTITGVATSIAAFFGRTQKGRMNQAVRVLSPSDFTRAFGGPHLHSDLAQSVRQFFDNGGSDCYVVRLAGEGAEKADITLTNFADANVLRAAAKSEGLWGNGIRLEIDYNTVNPDDTFNLRVSCEEQGRVVSEESFTGLSMNPDSPRFAPTLVSQDSELIDLELHDDMGEPEVSTSYIRNTANTPEGFSQGRRPFPSDPTSTATVENLDAELTALLGTNCCFEIDVNGTGFQPVDLNSLGDQSTASGIDAIASAIAAEINRQLYGVEVACAWDAIQTDSTTDAPTRVLLRITSATEPHTGVTIRRARVNDLAGPLMLGISQGGIEVARYSNLRPVSNGMVFMGATQTSSYPGVVDTLAGLPLSAITSVTIDGDPTPPINIDQLDFDLTDFFYQSPDGGTDGVRERLRRLAKAVTNHPDLPWRGEVWGYHLAFLRTEGRFHESGELASTPSSTTELAGSLISNVRRYPLGHENVCVYQEGDGQGGEDGAAPRVQDYRGDEAEQTGFHALDSVDLFNLMVLPGDQDVTPD